MSRSESEVGFRTGDGRRLSYRELGHGPVLVCHPGGPGFSSRYFTDLAGLGGDFTLMMLNPRGTAGSERPMDRRAYQIEDYAADLEEFRRHLGVDRMRLLGHSHGGVVAIRYAADHPENVERLVLANSLARFQAEQEEAMEAAMQKRSDQPWYEDARAAIREEQEARFETDQELAELFFREMPMYFAHFGAAESEYLDDLRAEAPNADALSLFNREIFETFDLRPALGRISAPTLVLTGDEDFITGPAGAGELAAGIPGSRFVRIPRAGHMSFVEARHRFRQEISRFLLAA